ncbi:ligand-binding sensor domain-containing protein [Saccharicrinis sp. GN24d3]|uniref:ligand-binding sensor domain-containing protein n=1 Tax=Saccharicrinis sp. GN24d3 TaxID=3458416 RepID=UPI0040367E49
MKQTIVLVLLVALPVISFSKNKAVRFQKLTIADGLSLSSVYCVHRDSKGYMWFGTEDGLNRYDGYRFKVFRTNVKESNSICYKWIEHIYEDSSGNLWFGSKAGLSKFNPQKEHFTNFSSSSTQPNKLTQDTITCLLQVSDSLLLTGTTNGIHQININSHQVQSSSIVEGRINQIKLSDNDEAWICTNKGLYRFSSKQNTYTQELPTSVNTPLPVNAMLQQENTLWLAGAQKLYRYDLETQSLKTSHILSQAFTNENIESIVADKHNRFWISTNQGLYLYHVQSDQSQLLIGTTNNTNSLSINTQKPLTFDSNGILWFGTHGDGLYLIYPDLQIRQHKYNPIEVTGISQNAINCIYNDTVSGNIWLGTFGAGLNMFNAFANKFDILKHNPLDPNSLSSDFIWSIQEDKDGSLWIGTNDKGISHYYPSEDKFEFFDDHPQSKGSLSNTSVREIFQDSQGSIWIGTDGGGLNRYNASSRDFKVYKNTENNPYSISDNSVRVVYEDNKGQLWIGTKNGLNKFNRLTQRFTRYLNDESDPASISNNFVYSAILEDKSGFLWIGTYGGGLNRMDTQNETFKAYTTHNNHGKSLSNDIVFSLFEDDTGLIWIGTNQGLSVLNPSNDSIRIFSLDDGLPNEVIYGILPDDNGLLWLSTNRGISCFNPKNESFTNYDVNDGLQSNEFNGGAFHRGNSGRLYFGGVYGLNMIDPDQMSKNKYCNPTIITSLEVLGQPVKINKAGNIGDHKISLINEQLQMDRHITYTSEVVLDYSHRFFSLEFSGLNHLLPEKTKYKYQMYPIDKYWREAGNRNYVSYANIEPGNYLFKVKASNPEGLWPDEATELRITVQPPFWLTYWFITIEILFVLLMIVFVHRFLIKIKLNKALKIQNKRIKTVNLKLKESENSLKRTNAAKDRFFSIISHDLKNPFASLMSISEVLANHYDESDEEDRKMCVARINASLKNVYSLLENLLTWSRSQRGVIEFKKSTFNLSNLITENINLNLVTSQKKNITLKAENINSHMAYGDRDTINTIIRNLTANALKYTKPGGTVNLTITDHNGTHWKISVIDTGLGISKDNLTRLFSIDQKVKTDGTSGEKGTGLGLIICKEFAEKNDGTIGVSSEIGKGSTFWFTVPKAPP